MLGAESLTMHQIAMPPMVIAEAKRIKWLNTPLRDVRRLISSSVDAAPTQDTM